MVVLLRPVSVNPLNFLSDFPCINTTAHLIAREMHGTLSTIPQQDVDVGWGVITGVHDNSRSREHF